MRKPENRCLCCKLPHDYCYCQELLPIELETKVTILMHCRERSLTSNTANLLDITNEKTNLLVRGEIKSPLLKDVLEIEAQDEAYFLFPDEEAISIEELVIPQGKRLHLVVPDGNWGQARKMKRRESILKELPSLKIPIGKKSLYRLREQPREEGLCTYEAILRCLEKFENEESVKNLRKNFVTMVNQVLLTRGLQVKSISEDDFDA